MTFITTGVLAFGGNKKAKGKQGNFKQVMAQLKLSEDQKDKLKVMRSENRDKSKMSKGEMKDLHMKLEVGFSGQETESELRSLHQKIKTIRMAKMDKRFERMMRIRSVLNSTQRKKFFELHKNMRKNRKGH
jgi:protein CpxP